jgi:hypothetical protein
MCITPACAGAAGTTTRPRAACRQPELLQTSFGLGCAGAAVCCSSHAHVTRPGQGSAVQQGRAGQCSAVQLSHVRTSSLGEVAGGCGCTPRGGSRAFPECTLALTAWCSGLANPRGTACRVDKGRVDSAHLQPGRHGAQRSGCRSGQQRQPVIAEGRLGTGPREPASPSRPAMRAGSVCARPLLLARARTAPRRPRVTGRTGRRCPSRRHAWSAWRGRWLRRARKARRTGARA